MKHKVGTALAVVLLSLAAATVVWIAFARSDSVGTGAGSAGSPGSPSARPTPSASPSFAVPAKTVNPLTGGSYCATAKLLGIYAHQSYGLDPKLGLVAGRQFGRRLEVVAASYRRLAAQAAKTADVGAAAPKAWRTLAVTVAAAEQKLRVTGYDVQSQVMILELSKVAKATQIHLPTATATLPAACGATREALGL